MMAAKSRQSVLKGGSGPLLPANNARSTRKVKLSFDGQDMVQTPDPMPVLKEKGFKPWDVFEAARQYAEAQQLEVSRMQEELEKKDKVIKDKDAEIERLKTQIQAQQTGINYEPLHWDPAMQRKGLKDSVERCNHVAIIVSDVGRSATFYSEVVGLQQITRPDFDRFGAWFTIGNVELHLIKGVPIVPHGNDLIVGHISLECKDMGQVLQGLKNMGIPFEQNISVPGGKGKAASEGGDLSNTVVQYFVRDPDGYYLEFCNCEILTDFCLQNHSVFGKEGAVLPYYEESGASSQMLQALGENMTERVGRWLESAREHVKKDQAAKYACLKELDKAAWPAADPKKLANLKKRQLVYCDITQSFKERELEDILRAANNDVPMAFLLMQKRVDEGRTRKARPPGYFKTKDRPSAIARGSVFFYTPPEFALGDSDDSDGEPGTGTVEDVSPVSVDKSEGRNL